MRHWLFNIICLIVLSQSVAAQGVPVADTRDLTYWVPELAILLVLGPLPREILPPALRGLPDQDLDNLRYTQDDVAFDYNCAGSYAPMIPYELRGLALAKVLGDDFMANQSVQFLYIAYLNSEQPAEALKCAEYALATCQAEAQPAASPDDLANCLADIALAYYYLDQPEQALTYAGQAIEQAHGQGFANAVQTYLTLAQIYIDAKDLAQALPYVEQALERYKADGSAFGQVEMLCLRGELKQEQGDLAGAEADYAAAGELAAGLPETAARSIVCERQGSLALARGDATQARNLFQEAVAQARALSANEQEVRALIGLGQAQCELREFEASIGSCELALAMVAECRLAGLEAPALMAGAKPYLALRHFDKAREMYLAAREANQGKDPELEADALCKLGEIGLSTQRYAEAVEGLTAALAVLDPQAAPEKYRRALFNRGQAYVGIEAWAEAQADLAEAARLGRLALGTGYFCPAQAQLAYVLLRQNDTAGALRAARQAKCVSAPELAEGEAWLEYLLVPRWPAPATEDVRCSERAEAGQYLLLAFLERPDQPLAFAQLDFDVPERQTLKEWVAQLRSDLQGEDAGLSQRTGAWLYEDYIAPVAGDLAGVTRLYLCPDPALAGLDFAQLPVPGRGKLGEVCELVQVPLELKFPPDE